MNGVANDVTNGDIPVKNGNEAATNNGNGHISETERGVNFCECLNTFVYSNCVIVVNLLFRQLFRHVDAINWRWALPQSVLGTVGEKSSKLVAKLAAVVDSDNHPSHFHHNHNSYCSVMGWKS